MWKRERTWIRVAVDRLERHVADQVVGLPHRRLRPRVRVRDAALADLHHQLVFGKDRRRAFPFGLLGRHRHPVDALRRRTGRSRPASACHRAARPAGTGTARPRAAGRRAGRQDAPGRQRSTARAPVRRARRVVGLDAPARRCAPAPSPASITTSCASRCSKSGPALGNRPGSLVGGRLAHGCGSFGRM